MIVLTESATQFGNQTLILVRRSEVNEIKKKLMAVNMHTSQILTPRQILSKSFYNKMTGASYSIFISLNTSPTHANHFLYLCSANHWINVFSFRNLFYKQMTFDNSKSIEQLASDLCES